MYIIDALFIFIFAPWRNAAPSDISCSMLPPEFVSSSTRCAAHVIEMLMMPMTLL
jgi:hypothetical protein